MKKYLLSILLIVALFFCLKFLIGTGVPYIKKKSELKGEENQSNQMLEENNFSMQDVDIRVINLDRSTKRYEEMKKQLDGFGLKHSRFSAIDGYKIKLIDPDTNETITGKQIKEGKELRKEVKYKLICSDDDKFDSYYIYTKKAKIKRQITAGELGVACSHRKLWYELANSKQQEKIMLILEDDVVFKYNPQYFYNFAKFPKEWDVIYTDHELLKNNFVGIHSAGHVKVKYRNYGLWSYFVDAKFANNLLIETTILNDAIDTQLKYYAIDQGDRLNIFSQIGDVITTKSNQFPSEITDMGR